MTRHPMPSRRAVLGGLGAAALTTVGVGSADAAPRPRTPDPRTPRFEVVADGLDFPEGPVVLRDGRVVLTEIGTGTISVVEPSGQRRTLVTVSGGPNGIAVGPDGLLYVTDDGGFTFATVNGFQAPGDQPATYRGGRILRVSPDTGETTVLYCEYEGRTLRGPNDLVFDRHGGFWFTDTGKQRPDDLDQGALYYATTDGRSLTRVVDRLSAPNGLTLSPDGRTLYVSETNTGRMWSWPVIGPGRLRNGPVVFNAPTGAQLFHKTAGIEGLDSMKPVVGGGVAVARIFGTGDILALDAAGHERGVVSLPRPDPLVSNLAVDPVRGGGRTVYVTSGGLGLLYRCRHWPFPLVAPRFTV